MKRARLLAWLLYLLPLLVFGWIVFINRFPDGYAFTAGDFSQPRNIQETFHNFFYVWNNQLASVAEGGYFSWFSAFPFYFLFYFLPSKLGLSDTNTLSFILFSFLSLSYLSFLLAVKTLFSRVHNGFAALLSFIYAANSVTLFFFTYAWGFSHQILLYIFIPALVALFCKILETKKFKYILFFLLTLFFSTPSYTNSAFALSLAIYLFLVTILALVLKIIRFSRSLVLSLLVTGLGALGVVGYWLLPTLSFLKMGLAITASGGGIFDLASWLRSHSSNVLSILLNLPDYGTHYPFKYEAVIFSLLTFIVISLFIFSLLKKNYTDRRERQWRLLFALMFIIFAILVKKTSPPLSFFTVQIFRLPLLAVLRSYEKTAVFLPFSLLIPVYVFSANISQRKNRILVASLLFLSLLTVRPYFTGGIQTNYSVTFPKGKNYLSADYAMLTKIPNAYYDLASISNENKTDTRILSAPFGALNSISWVNYPRWKMIGNDSTVMLFSKNTLSANSPAYLSYGWHPYQSFNSSTFDPQWYINYLSLFSVSEIIYHKDVAPRFVAQSSQKIALLESRGLITPLAKTEYADLYSVNTAKILPHFYVPKSLIASAGKIDAISSITSFNDYDLRTGIYFLDLGQRVPDFLNSPDNPTNSLQTFIKPDKVEVTASLYQKLNQKEIDALVMPGTRILPNSLLYFYVSYKEASLLKKETDLLSRTDLLLWLSGKRIMEMEQLASKGDEKQAFFTMRRYLDFLNDLVENLNTLSKERAEYYKLLEKVQRYFTKHAMVAKKVAGIINTNSFKNLMDEMEELHKKANLLTPLKDHDLYLLKIPYDGSYNLLLRTDKNTDSIFDVNPFKKLDLIMDNTLKKTFVGEKRADGWYEYPNVFSSSGYHSLYLPRFQSRNLITNGSFESPSFSGTSNPPVERSIEAVDGNFSLKLTVDPGDEQTISFTIADFIPGDTYRFSFYCHSLLGTPLEIGVWEISDLNKKDVEPDIDEYSHYASLACFSAWQWQTFDISSSNNSKQMRLIIKLPASDDKSIALLDDLRVERVFIPEIVVRQSEASLYTNKTFPKLTFTKVNPTKYRVLVQGATSPYLLVFSESFQDNWKLYLKKAIPGQDYSSDFGTVTASYFDGEIEEGRRQQVFWDKLSWETWFSKPSAEENHYLVNGYGNSWYITPQNTAELSTYELVVELWPQRLFYIGLAVSGVSLLTCLASLFFVVKKSNFRPSE